MIGLELISKHLERLATVAAAPPMPPPLIHGFAQPMAVPLPPTVLLESSPLPPPPPPEAPSFLPPPPPSEEALRSVAAASAESRLLTATRLVEVVEALAEENNIIMVPKKGRKQNGKQVYEFGSVHIYIDAGIIYALESAKEIKTWQIVSLAGLLKRAVSSSTDR